ESLGKIRRRWGAAMGKLFVEIEVRCPFHGTKRGRIQIKYEIGRQLVLCFEELPYGDVVLNAGASDSPIENGQIFPEHFRIDESDARIAQQKNVGFGRHFQMGNHENALVVVFRCYKDLFLIPIPAEVIDALRRMPSIGRVDVKIEES